MKAIYQFNCVDGFDPEGDCLFPLFADASEFGCREEDFRNGVESGDDEFLTRKEFRKSCEVIFPIKKSWEYYIYPETEYFQKVYVVFDPDECIHYFWS